MPQKNGQLDRAAISAIRKDAAPPEFALPRRIKTMEKLPLNGTGDIEIRALNRKGEGRGRGEGLRDIPTE